MQCSFNLPDQSIYIRADAPDPLISISRQQAKKSDPSQHGEVLNEELKRMVRYYNVPNRQTTTFSSIESKLFVMPSQTASKICDGQILIPWPNVLCQ